VLAFFLDRFGSGFALALAGSGDGSSLCDGRPRPHPGAIHEVDRRIQDHLVSGFDVVACFDLRSEVAHDRYLWL